MKTNQLIGNSVAAFQHILRYEKETPFSERCDDTIIYNNHIDMFDQFLQADELIIHRDMLRSSFIYNTIIRIMGARMLRKGLAVAVILLFIGVAFAIPINANVSNSSLEPVSDIEALEEELAKKHPDAKALSLFERMQMITIESHDKC